MQLVEREESRRGAERARGSLLEFLKQAWPFIEPGTPLLLNWHIEAKCDHLEAVARGEITRLLINEPPGHLKSIVVSVMWPAWMWIHRPEWRAIFGSYAQPLSTRDSMKCRDVITSPWYQLHFAQPGGWDISADQNTKTLFANTRHGFRQATSVGGGATGHRGNAVVFDDPLNLLDAYSKNARDEANLWIDKAMSNRLNDLKRDVIVMVMQRLHQDDPAGHVLAQGGYEHLCLPSEFDPKRRSITYHVVPAAPQPVASLRDPTAPTVERREFWRDPRQAGGELLFPAKFPADILEAEKKRLLDDGYAGQHQQLPMPPGGGMFKVKDWSFWKPDGYAPTDQHPRDPEWYQGPARGLPREWDRLIISVDATFKETTDGSFVAIHVWGASGPDRYLLDRVHERMDFEATVAALRSVIKRWPAAREKVIEGKANGDAIKSTLEKRHGIAGIIMESPDRQNKEQRARAMLPYQRAGNVYLPDGAPWLGEYIGEHGLFPKGVTNDDVDCQSQALKHLETEDSEAAKWQRYFDQQRAAEEGDPDEIPPDDE